MSNPETLKKMSDKELKSKLVEVLGFFDKICVKNKIQYSLIGGSLIGAIRHKGIIPWDDDIDVIMTPKELKKLKAALKKENNPKYKLLEPNKDGCYYSFPKLVSTDTIVDEFQQKEIPNYGVYVDIFTYHYISGDKKAQDIFWKKYCRYHTGIYTTNAKHSAWPRNPKYRFKYIWYNYFAKANYTEKMIDLFDSLPKNDTGFLVSSDPTYGLEHDIIPSEWIKDFIRVPFENIEASIYKKYDDVLRIVFGDYMQLPPKEKQVTHHTYNAYYKIKK